MSNQRAMIRLSSGDVSTIRIVSQEKATRVLVYQGAETLPLIEATLSITETALLRRSLSQTRRRRLRAS